MALNFLDFEQPIAELEEKINSLANINNDGSLNKELEALKQQSDAVTRKIFSKLSDWQITQLARHPQRLHTADYIPAIFENFIELHGDGMFADDRAMIGGLAKLSGEPVMLIGQQKGRNTQDKLSHNFGMSKPEGYRKARRLMCLAEKFSLPVITLVDTPGAYPGIDAEERGQSESIATNLATMSKLKTPVITAIIGEGGSGGALAIGVADRVLMFEYSIYSVISPEGCASILYKDSAKAEIAAASLKLTSKHLKEQGLIDVIIPEPLGGVHRHPDEAKERLKNAISKELNALKNQKIDQLIGDREQRILQFGHFKYWAGSW